MRHTRSTAAALYNAPTARTDVQNRGAVGVGFHRGANALASGYLPAVCDTRALTGGGALDGDHSAVGAAAFVGG